MAAAAGTVTTKAPEALALETEALPAKARMLSIADEATYKAAASFLTGVKALRAEVEATFGPMQRAAYAAWQEVLGQRKRIETPMAEAERIVKAEVVRFQTEEERRRREEAARAAAEARRVQEEARLREAEALEAAGDREAADAVLEEPELPPPPPPAPVKAYGVAVREKWRARVTDKRALLQAVLDGKAPLDAVEVVQGALDKLAGVYKAELAIPGVVAYRDDVVAARAGA